MLRHILASFLLTACSSSAVELFDPPELPSGERPGGDPPQRPPQGNPDPDPGPGPTVKIAFPPPASTTSAATMIVRGTAVGAVDLRVNGVLATTDDGFATWRAEVPLAAGANTIVTTATTATGGSSNRSVQVTVRGEIPDPGELLAIDSTNAYSVDFAGRLIATDRTTGRRSVVPGLDLPSVRGIAIDRVHGEIVVNALNGLVGFDLATGTKRVIASGFFGAIAVDDATGVVYADENFNDVLVAFDLATGARTLVSSDTRGTGPALRIITGIAVDPTRGRLLLLNGSPLGLLAVDLATGDRVIASSPAVGSGPMWHGRSQLTLDVAGNRAFVAHEGNGLFEVALATGNRTSVPTPSTPPHVIFDAGELITSSLLGVARLDIATGISVPVVDPDLGSGPGLIESLAIVATEGGAIVANDTGGPDELITVDLATRQREIRGDGFAVTALDPGHLLVAESSGLFDLEFATGSKIKRSDLSGQAVAVSGDRAFVLTSFASKIFEVDLATGDFSIIHDLGNGQTTTDARMVATSGRLLFTDDHGVRALDLVTAEATTIITLVDPLALAVDGERALVGDGDSLLAVELAAPHAVTRLDTVGPSLASLQAIAVTSDDRAFAMTGQGLQLVDLQTGHHVLVGGR